MFINKSDVPKALLLAWEGSSSKLHWNDWVVMHYKAYREGLSPTMKPLTITRWMALYRPETYRSGERHEHT